MEGYHLSLKVSHYAHLKGSLINLFNEQNILFQFKICVSVVILKLAKNMVPIGFRANFD